MFSEDKIKKRIREVGRSALLPFVPPESEKFADKADFFGYPSHTVPAYGKDVYVCLPKNAQVFRKNDYVFCNETLPAQMYPQSKVYRLDKELTVVGDVKEERFFAVDPQKERLYYAFLSLYDATKKEKDKKLFKRRKKLLTEGTPTEILKETGKKERSYSDEGHRFFPPLICFPEEVIEYMLQGAGETVCFPQGGLWKGLIPVLSRSGVKRVVLPLRKGTEKPFRWTEDKYSVDVFYRRIPSEEEKIVGKDCSVTGDPFVAPEEEGSDERTDEPPILTGEKKDVTDEGTGEGLLPEKRRVGNGKIFVESVSGRYYVPGKEIRLSLLYTDGKTPHRCGRVSERNYVSGRFVLFESHYYFREATARVRFMLEKDAETVRVDYDGDKDGFLLVLETENAKTVVRRLPFGDVRENADGVFYARDGIVIEGQKEISVECFSVLYEKKGNVFLFPLKSFDGKRSIIID